MLHLKLNMQLVWRCLKAKHEKEIACLNDENACLKLKKLELENAISNMPSSSKTCDCESILNENVLLNTKIVDLQNILSKFTLGHKNFNMLIGSQKCAFKREGL